MTDILSKLAALTEMDCNGLLPCSCGGNAIWVRQPSRAYGDYQIRLRCSLCRIQTANKASQSECISIWNAREATLIALAQEAAVVIERLAKENRKLNKKLDTAKNQYYLQQALNPQEPDHG